MRLQKSRFFHYALSGIHPSRVLSEFKPKIVPCGLSYLTCGLSNMIIITKQPKPILSLSIFFVVGCELVS